MTLAERCAVVASLLFACSDAPPSEEAMPAQQPDRPATATTTTPQTSGMVVAASTGSVASAGASVTGAGARAAASTSSAGAGGTQTASPAASGGAGSVPLESTTAGKGAEAMSTAAQPMAAGATALPQSPQTLTLLDHAWFSGPELGYDTQFMDEPVELGAGPFAEVTLTFRLESPCFPFDKWTDNPPPAGEAFPAQCDRFDRLMYFEMDPALEESDAAGMQVLRAITPYGGPLEKTVDITDFANARPGAHSLRSFVGTWVDDEGQVSGSDGGYFLSVEVETKPGPPPRAVLSVFPLWSGWVGVETMLPELPFTLPEGTTHAQLVYLVTGHGGAMDPSSACIGAADEFCKRTHHLYFDGTELTPDGFSGSGFVPWRDDCSELCTLAQGHPMMGSYCQQNPNRAVRNVTGSRANWCPGDDVEPILTPLLAAQATPGEHRVRFAIDDIYPDGRWQVALAVYAYAD